MSPEELEAIGQIAEHLKALAAANRATTRTVRAQTRELQPKINAALWALRHPRYRPLRATQETDPE